MTRILRNLALGASLALVALPADLFAGGRGGGGGGRGGGGMSRGGGGGGMGGGGMSRGGGGMGGGMSGGGMSRGGGGGMGGSPMGRSPSMSTPRPSPSQGRSPQSGNMGMANRTPTARPLPSPGQGGGNMASRPNFPNAGAGAAGAGIANRNPTNFPNAGAGAAGAGIANRNPTNFPNSGAAAAGAGIANRNPTNFPNAGAAAAGAGIANRNPTNFPNAGAAAAGAGIANRNQPNFPNAGAAAAGAGIANRNQSNLSNAGAAAIGAGVANRNQPNLSNAGAAAIGAGIANRNQYNRFHPGLANGYWHRNNSAAWGVAGLGLGLATGVAAWGAGSPMFGWGYSSYSNPYSAVPVEVGGEQPVAYDYAQPISTTAPPPEPTVAEQASSTFDQAREAFRNGDYNTALQLNTQALSQMPNDATLHEFLGLVLFAQGKFEQAASPLYAILTVGPGWDWTTLISMYADAGTYTTQLRALEEYAKANPKSAQARFVLAYHYMTQGHEDSALTLFQEVVKLQPSDTVSAQLIAALQPQGAGQPTAPPTPAAAGAEGQLPGNWVATPAAGAKVTLAIQDDGAFIWTASSQGKPPATIKGAASYAEGVLSLTAEGSQDGALVGQTIWQDPNHFTFRLVGAPANDPGLKFAR